MSTQQHSGTGPTTFGMSPKQIKAIADGDPSVLALPLLSQFTDERGTLDMEMDELKQIVIDSLPDVEMEGIADRVDKLRIGNVWVHLVNRGGGWTPFTDIKAGKVCLTAIMGDIIDTKRRLHYPCYNMRVIFVRFNDVRPMPARWPGGQVIWARPEGDKFQDKSRSRCFGFGK